MGYRSAPLRPLAGGPRSVRPGRLAAAAAALALTVSCGAGPSGAVAPPAPAAGPPPAAAAPVAPVTAGINQLRDNYSRQIIAVQLTNNTAGPVTVLSAAVASPLFAGTIEWQAAPGGTELPPGQTKILPAQLRTPVCSPRATPTDPGATVAFRLADGSGAGPGGTVRATDPYGVMSRNNTEMCLAQAVAEVADIRLLPELEAAAGAHSAVLTLSITPRPGAGSPAATQSLTLARIDGTTLLDEDPEVPWPRSVSVRAGDSALRVRLGIRPARCDPHAIADDKVGTLLPLRVSAGGRDGILKIDAGALLRGRLYDFLTTACGRQ
ncbi:hypothetical protein VUN84_09620 [Micrococcaceae bacterium Sec5.8]